MEVGCLRHPGASTIGSQLLDGDHSHDWQIQATQPWAPTPSQRTSEQAWHCLEKRGAHGRGSQSPKEKCPNPTAPRKAAQMKGGGAHTCLASHPATERMVSTGVHTYNKCALLDQCPIVLMRWSGRPFLAAVVAAPIWELWPENFPGIPADCRVVLRKEDSWDLERGVPFW